MRESWYPREVHRYAVDHRVYAGSSLRRVAMVLKGFSRSYEAAEEALLRLRAYPGGAQLVQRVCEQQDRLLYHLLPSHECLMRISTEWLWRDFCLRLSHGMPIVDRTNDWRTLACYGWSATTWSRTMEIRRHGMPNGSETTNILA